MTETIEEVKSLLAKVRVENAYLRADLVKAEIYKDEVVSLRKDRDRLKVQVNSLASINSRLTKKLYKYEGGKNAKPDSDAVEPDDRADDPIGDSGCGISD